MSSHETLGLILVREGLITRPQLYDALRLQRQNSRLLGTCLLQLGYLDADRLLAILAKQLAVPALPRGLLLRASPEAVRRVPAEVALRLRIVPFSWDGEMLGVAVSDGRVLNHLHEVALHAKAAVGAYVALETEIDETLPQLYRVTSEVQPDKLDGRPRPPTVATQEAARGAAPAPSAPLRKPGRAPTFPPIEKVGVYDAVEKIYEAESFRSVGRAVGQALLNYFSRVVVFELQEEADGTHLHVVAYAGMTPARDEVAAADLPNVAAQLADPRPIYGRSADEPRGAELARAFGLGDAVTCILAPIAAGKPHALLAYGDNAEVEDLYDDLHDVEMLFKEAETALGLLTR